MTWRPRIRCSSSNRTSDPTIGCKGSIRFRPKAAYTASAMWLAFRRGESGSTPTSTLAVSTKRSVALLSLMGGMESAMGAARASCSVRLVSSPRASKALCVWCWCDRGWATRRGAPHQSMPSPSMQHVQRIRGLPGGGELYCSRSRRRLLLLLLHRPTRRGGKGGGRARSSILSEQRRAHAGGPRALLEGEGGEGREVGIVAGGLDGAAGGPGALDAVACCRWRW